MNKEEFARVSAAIDAAITRVLTKGADDIFKPPVFSHSIESGIMRDHGEDFRKEAFVRTLRFVKAADLATEPIGPTRRSLVSKDQNSFRQVAWLDPFDAITYLTVALLLFPDIEVRRPDVAANTVHSHRRNSSGGDIFLEKYGYDSFRQISGDMSKDRIGQWKVVTDIANFFDRIGNHTLENHLRNCNCDAKFITLLREMLFFWTGDRRSFGIPVGSDASRIISEAVLLDVDRRLAEAGIEFVRYVDDYRLFAPSRALALRAVETLTSLLADEGLSLNSRKTSISKIVDSGKFSQFTNRFSTSEHEKIDLEEKVEVKRAVNVSGRTSISRFYRQPGQEALKRIREYQKEDILKLAKKSDESDFEDNVKLAVKFFVYVEHDSEILSSLIETRITSIYYIVDALTKESSRLPREVREDVVKILFKDFEWLDCAYPLQLPVVKLSAQDEYANSDYVRNVIDSQRRTDSMIFYREVVSVGFRSLDRARLRRMAIDEFEAVPDFVKRAIFHAVANHPDLSEDERRPILKNMKQSTRDWFIHRM